MARPQPCLLAWRAASSPTHRGRIQRASQTIKAEITFLDANNAAQSVFARDTSNPPINNGVPFALLVRSEAVWTMLAASYYAQHSIGPNGSDPDHASAHSRLQVTYDGVTNEVTAIRVPPL